MAKSSESADRELAAIKSILDALEGLDGESIQRVFDYIFGRLSINAPRHSKLISAPSTQPQVGTEAAHGRRVSIRDLKEDKKPESSNQMAALVAYYLSEIADGDDRKETVNTADLERYFKQAGFKLPKSMPSTLPNAAAAGYFDSTGSGHYKLNAVGYNLVAHGLPRAHSMPAKAKRVTKRRPRKKSARG